MVRLGWMCLVTLLGVAVVGARAQQQPIAPMPPEKIPSDAESKFIQRMHQHAADLLELTHAVTVLDRKAVAQVADRIRLDTALTLGADAGVSRDPRFQALDQQLRERVTELATAARRYDDVALAPAFGRTMETCVKCHVAYLKPKKAGR